MPMSSAGRGPPCQPPRALLYHPAAASRYALRSTETQRLPDRVYDMKACRPPIADASGVRT